MNKQEVKDFITKSYKRTERVEVIRADEDTITIVDKDGFNVPYKFVAKKLIKKFDVDCVHIKVGCGEGNGWVFYRSVLYTENYKR